MNGNVYIAVRPPSAAFFRFGAIAAAAAVLGIVVAQLILKPDEPDPGITGLIATYADAVFQAQSLAILVQVVAMFVALLVVAVKVGPHSPGVTVLAVAFLILWQVLELYPRAIDYFTFSKVYADSYLADSANQAFVEDEFRRFLSAADGLRNMRQIVWSAGLLFLGAAMNPMHGVGRWVAALLLLNGVRVTMVFALSMIGSAMPFGTWVFIVVNVALFSLVAYWLWTTPILEEAPTE